MKRINKERTPPLPVDKPATYDNKRVKKSPITDATRHNECQPDLTAAADPQKTREKIEHDETQRERNPVMNNKKGGV